MKKTILMMFSAMMLVLVIISCAPPGHGRPPHHNGDCFHDNAVKGAIAERIRDGESIREILPPPGVMIAGVMVPISGIIGFFAALILFLNMHHKKVTLMIEKGIYQPKPLNIKWDMIFMLIGVLTSFTGIGVSLFMIGYYGVHPWTFATGSIPFFVGIGFIVLAALFKKMKD